MTPPLTLRVRIDYDGDNNADIERRIATCIARQWRVRLDDACRCSFDAVAIDGVLDQYPKGAEGLEFIVCIGG